MKIEIEEELFDEMFNYIFIVDMLTAMILKSGEARTYVAINKNERRMELLDKLKDLHKKQYSRLILKSIGITSETL